MFTALFGKRRSSPVDDNPALPGPRADDGFVLVNSTASPGSYPSMSEQMYPQRRAPPLPGRKQCDSSFHYLQGVPFALARHLQISANKDAFAAEIGDLLAFLTHKINMNSYSYDFSVEKSVLKEC